MAEFSMHRAAANGDLKRVRELIDFGDMNGRNSRGETPLIIAARKGHREIVDLLIQYGAQVNCESDRDGWTFFHWACSKGWVDQVRLILEKGVGDLNEKTGDWKTPLILAAKKGHRKIVDLLIQYGAQVDCESDRDGWTFFHWACSKGWVDQVRLILEKGVGDLNEKTGDWKTPLILAARKGHREIVDLLIQYRAQVNCESDCDGWTLLHSACSKGWVDLVWLILEKGVGDVNEKTHDWKTPLILAARKGHREMVDLLIQYGAQVNCESDCDGWTFFHWACSRGWVDQVRLILEKGVADLNGAANDEDTPLKVALRFGHREIFFLLFQYGAIMDVDYELISKHSFMKVAFKDVNLCTQLIVKKFQCQSLPTLYRNPDIAKKLPIFKNFILKDQQTQEIAKFVESEVKSKNFCNIFNSKPIVLMILCVQSLISQKSTRKMSASSDSKLPFKKPRLN